MPEVVHKHILRKWFKTNIVLPDLLVLRNRREICPLTTLHFSLRSCTQVIRFDFDLFKIQIQSIVTMRKCDYMVAILVNFKHIPFLHPQNCRQQKWTSN